VVPCRRILSIPSSTIGFSLAEHLGQKPAPDTYLAFPSVYFHYWKAGPKTRQILGSEERQQGSGVAEVHVVVDGNAADVHADPAGNQRDERLFGPAQRIEDLQGVDCGGPSVRLE
jgi:hypothetical protein